MSYKPAHLASCRAAGIIRRINQEGKLIAMETDWRDNIEVALPPNHEGDENVSIQDVLNDKVPHARLMLHDKVISKSKIAAMLVDSDADIAVSRNIIRSCQMKFNKLGLNER